MPEVFKNGAWQPYDGPVSTEPPPPPSSMLRRVAGDTAVSALKGAIGLPEAAVGLADIPTGGRAGLLAEKAGVKFKESKEILDTLYSPEQKAANARVSEAKGFVPTLTTMLQNPSTIYQAAVESAPSIVGGAGVARGFLRLAPKVAPLLAGAIGEGAVTAGSAAEGVRQQTEDGTLTAKQSAIAAGTGAVTSLLGVAGGKVAQRLGIADIDTLLAGGASEGTKKNVIRRLAEGVVAEGALEELPQSAQEQAAQNLALGRPVTEGVAEAAASGLLVGGAMGGGVAAVSGKGKTVEKKDPVHQAVLDTLLEKATGAETAADDIISEKVAEATAPAPITSQFGDEIPGEAAASRVSQFGETASDPWALRETQTPESLPAPAAVAPEAYLGDVIPEQGSPFTPQGIGRQEVLNPEVSPLTPETEMEKSQREWLGGASLGQYATKEALYRDALARTGTPEGARAWMQKIYETESAPPPLAAQVETPAATETKIPEGVTKSHYLAGVKEANASVLTEGLDSAVQKYKDMTAQLHDTGPDSVVTRREQSVLRAYKDVLSGYGAYVGEDRRTNTARRKEIDAMTPAQKKIFLRHEVSGIPNRIAYETQQRKPVQVAIDADSLKWVNDNMGHGSGDKMLKAVGAALAAESPNAYHISGDEFVLEADTQEEAQAIMSRVAQRLSKEELKHIGAGGRAISKKGLEISYGAGATLAEADANMYQQKKGKKRGAQPPGVVKFSQDDKLAFFSKVKDLVESKMGGSMPLAQLKTMLKNNGATDDEITQTLSGLEGKDKVTKAEVLEEIQANGVELTDVVLGEPSETIDSQWRLVYDDGTAFGTGFVTQEEAQAELDDLFPGRTDISIQERQTGDSTGAGRPLAKPTQFSSYQEPGAKEGSYREMFVTAPETKKSNPLFDDYLEKQKSLTGDEARVLREKMGIDRSAYMTYISATAPMWKDGHSQYSDVQNPVVRIRFNERGADGKKILFVEEMQGPSDAEQAKMPDYLKKRIYDLGVKRVLAYAKANGFDGISWTPGEMQAKRYDLSKQVDSIRWYKSKKGEGYLISADKDGENVASHEAAADKLPEVVGKELAKKITESGESEGQFSGLDLKVGGEGLKRLYDQTLPALFKKYGKEGVGEVELETLPPPDPKFIFHRSEYPDFKAPYIHITAKTPETYPLFSRGADNGRANRNDDQRQADQTPLGDRGLPGPGDGRNEAGRESLLSGVDLDLSRALGSYYNDRVPPGASFRVSGAPLQLGVEKVAKAFGVSVVVFDSIGGRGPNGFNVEGRIYINAKTKNQHLAIFGHELVHSMQEYAPDIYADLERVAIANGMTMTETLREETLGDYVGNKLTQKQFWDRLANAAPESFRIVLGYVRAMLAKVKGVLKSSNAGLTADFQEIEDAAVSALTRFAKRRNMTVKEVENGFLKSGNIVLQQRIERSKEASGLAEEASESAKQDPYFVRMSAAWHGSPHDFDAFKTSQIGTGEGAQAYGYGLYFAGNREVAEFYKKALAGDVTKLNADYSHLSENGQKKLREYQAYGNSKKMMIDNAENAARLSRLYDIQDKKTSREGFAKDMDALVAWLKDPEIKAEKPVGKLYSVELAPKESEYLLWDKPLSAQSETVKAALRKEFESRSAFSWDEWVASDQGMTGSNLYQMLSRRFSNPENTKSIGNFTPELTDFGSVLNAEKAASDYLHSLGIRGIKYLDGSSRAEGEGNYNYVIFNDEDVTITAKFSRETLNTVGEKLRPQMEAMKNLAAQGLRVMAPLDRAIDLHLSQKLYAPLHGLLKKYKDIKRMGDYIQNTMLTKAYGMYDDTLKAAGFESNWLKKNSPEAQKNMETFHQVVNHGTLAQIFPDRELKDQPWRDQEQWVTEGMPEKTGYKTLTEAHDVLSRAYKSLPESLRKQYQSKQAQLKEFTDAYVVALRNRILASTETGEAQNALLAQIDRRFKLKGPYAPLMRYGDFVLNVYDKQGGTRLARYQYDTTTTRADAERQILADNPGYWVEKSTRQQWSRAESNIPTSFIDAMNEIITASGANQEVANGILADMEQLWFSHAPETSVMKHSMRRTGLAGFDTSPTPRRSPGRPRLWSTGRSRRKSSTGCRRLSRTSRRPAATPRNSKGSCST
jgi:diguanylate cyclase (GGDEF)-like protein